MAAEVAPRPVIYLGVVVEVSSKEVILLKWGVGGSILEGGHLFGMGMEVSTKRVIPLR